MTSTRPNTERLLQIASHIEAEPDTFNMTRTLSKCGTVGCVAGQATILFDPQWIKAQGLLYGDVLGQAAEILDLTPPTAQELFLAHSLDGVVKDDYDGETFFCEGYRRIPDSAVPKALRWMVANSNYNWANALQALNIEPVVRL